jgi:hypothetical protein
VLDQRWICGACGIEGKVSPFSTLSKPRERGVSKPNALGLPYTETKGQWASRCHTSDELPDDAASGTQSLLMGRHQGASHSFEDDERAVVFHCGGGTRWGKAFVSQCVAGAPSGGTFREKTLRYQRTA